MVADDHGTPQIFIKNTTLMFKIGVKGMKGMLPRVATACDLRFHGLKRVMQQFHRQPTWVIRGHRSWRVLDEC